MSDGGTVVGCVWGAHRRLLDELDDDAAPTYEWCEAEWLRIRGEGPAAGSRDLPAWLTARLLDAWTDHLTLTYYEEHTP